MQHEPFAAFDLCVGEIVFRDGTKEGIVFDANVNVMFSGKKIQSSLSTDWALDRDRTQLKPTNVAMPSWRFSSECLQLIFLRCGVIRFLLEIEVVVDFFLRFCGECSISASNNQYQSGLTFRRSKKYDNEISQNPFATSQTNPLLFAFVSATGRIHHRSVESWLKKKIAYFPNIFHSVETRPFSPAWFRRWVPANPTSVRIFLQQSIISAE